jgi:hypothetical protein
MSSAKPYDHYAMVTHGGHRMCLHAEAPGQCPWDRLETTRVLGEVAEERRSQDAQWGEQNHPDGTGTSYMADHLALKAKQMTALHVQMGELTWHDILAEEFYEAMAESDPAKLRAELLQVSAVAAAWIESIDRRAGGDAR